MSAICRESRALLPLGRGVLIYWNTENAVQCTPANGRVLRDAEDRVEQEGDSINTLIAGNTSRHEEQGIRFPFFSPSDHLSSRPNPPHFTTHPSPLVAPFHSSPFAFDARENPICTVRPPSASQLSSLPHPSTLQQPCPLAPLRRHPVPFFSQQRRGRTKR